MQQARLDVPGVLILLAAILFDIAFDLVKKDLADRNTRIDLNGLDREHLQRPMPPEADIAKAGRHVNEQT